MYEERITGGVKFIPEKLSSPIPVAIAPGIGVSIRACNLLINTLCADGRIVICPTYPPSTAERPNKWIVFTDADNIKQDRMINIVESQAGSVDGIAISKGLFDFLPAATSYSDKLQTLTLISPAIQPTGNLLTNLWRLTRGDRKNQQQKAKLAVVGEEMSKRFQAIEEESKQYKKDWRSYYPEVITLAIKTVHLQMQKLSDAGIRIVIVAPEPDPLFPLQSYENLIQDSVESIIRVPGPHGAFKYNPAVCQVIANSLK